MRRERTKLTIEIMGLSLLLKACALYFRYPFQAPSTEPLNQKQVVSGCAYSSAEQEKA